ncbi:hypothetical protein ACRAWF_05120 [Streptomyces sp. L7]
MPRGNPSPRPLRPPTGQLPRGVVGAGGRARREPPARSVGAVWSPDPSKVPLLERDLRHFATLGAIPEPCPAATEFADEIRHSGATELLGFLYVLEGSTLGARFLLRYVTEAYPAHGRGTACRTTAAATAPAGRPSPSASTARSANPPYRTGCWPPPSGPTGMWP